MTTTRIYTLAADYDELECLEKALDKLVNEEPDEYSDLILFRAQIRRKLNEATRDVMGERRALGAGSNPPTYHDLDTTLVEFANANGE